MASISQPLDKPTPLDEPAHQWADHTLNALHTETPNPQVPVTGSPSHPVDNNLPSGRDQSTAFTNTPHEANSTSPHADIAQPADTTTPGSEFPGAFPKSSHLEKSTSPSATDNNQGSVLDTARNYVGSASEYISESVKAYLPLTGNNIPAHTGDNLSSHTSDNLSAHVGDNTSPPHERTTKPKRFSLPSQETSPNEHPPQSDGVGVLPGPLEEAGVAMLPEERAVGIDDPARQRDMTKDSGGKGAEHGQRDASDTEKSSSQALWDEHSVSANKPLNTEARNHPLGTEGALLGGVGTTALESGRRQSQGEGIKSNGLGVGSPARETNELGVASDTGRLEKSTHTPFKPSSVQMSSDRATTGHEGVTTGVDRKSDLGSGTTKTGSKFAEHDNTLAKTEGLDNNTPSSLRDPATTVPQTGVTGAMAAAAGTGGMSTGGLGASTAPTSVPPTNQSQIPSSDHSQPSKADHKSPSYDGNEPQTASHDKHSTDTSDSTRAHKPTVMERLKGEMKVISGRLGHNEEKVDEGKRMMGKN